MRRFHSLCKLLSVLGLAPSALASGEVFVVDATGNGTHTTIQAAVDAAGPDDLIHIADPPDPEAGGYPGFLVDGRGMTIVARIGARWTIGQSSIRNLPAGATVRLIGLGFGTGNVAPGVHGLYGDFADPFAGGLSITNSVGAIRIESCTIRGSAGLSLSNAADVLVDRSSVAGAQGATAAVRVSGSSLTLSSSSVHGVKGFPGDRGLFSCSFCIPAGPSYPGVVVTGNGSEVHVFRSQVTGGHAGVHSSCAFCDGYPAEGIVTDASGVVYTRESTIQSGWNEYTNATTSPFQGNVVQFGERARTLSAPAVATASGELRLSARGMPGEAAWLVVSEGAGRRSFDPEVGVAHFAPPYVAARAFLGTLDGTGRLQTTFPLPVPSGAGVQSYTVQLATSGVLGTRFGSAVSVVVLGPDTRLAPPGAAVHVDTAGDDQRSGRTWGTSVATLRCALGRAIGDLRSSSEVWLRTGHHRVEVSPGLTRPLNVPAGVTLLGGFAGFETDASQRDPLTPRAVVTGDVLGNDGPGFTNRADNAPGLLRQPLVWAEAASSLPAWRLDRIALEGAARNPSSTSNVIELFGPGTITDCVVTDNDVYGALIRCTHGDLTLRNTIVRGNFASHLVLSDEHYLVPVNACRVEGCLIAGNRVSSVGVRVTGAQSLQLSNSTVAYNTITFAHGTAVQASNARIDNSLLWNNARLGVRNEAAQLHVAPGSELRNSTIGGWTGALGGVACNGDDPDFRAPLGVDGVLGTADDDFRVRPFSPAIDSGDSTRVPGELTLDLDGRPRVGDDPAVPDTGVGGPPVVDRGAYER